MKEYYDCRVTTTDGFVQNFNRVDGIDITVNNFLVLHCGLTTHFVNTDHLRSYSVYRKENSSD